MENPIMKKYLFRTALVLAALTACNKEIDNQTPLTVDPVDETPAGKVTLTFKAAIDDATRTVYANDKTGSWEADDKITVCVTDGESFEIVDFTTEDGVTFSAEVSQNYTTIASAVYPANDEYAVFPEDFFDVTGDGDVIGLYLTNVLDIGLADDKGTLIPMVGSYDASTQTMSFHHVCGALKVTLSNIPDDATLFAFHANNQQLVFDFPLTNDGRIELGTPVEGNDDMDLFFHFTVDEETTTRSFYIPIPDGSLAAGAYVTLENEDGELLYKKVLSTAQTFNKNNIKRLPTAECWTRNENWDAYYYGPYQSSGSINKRISLVNMTGSYNYEVLTTSQFNNTYHGSAAEYLSSDHFSTRISGLTTSYSSSGLSLNYTALPKGKYYVMLFGLDQDRKFTGEYNCVEVVNPTFSTPEGWSISVTEGSRNVVKYSVPSNDTEWMNISITPSTLETTYLNDLEYAIYYFIRSRKASYESDPSNWAPRAGTQSYYFDNTGEYILLCVGLDENYRPTGEYCRLDYSFETPTEAYNAWIGKWTVTDGTNTDTWTISRKQANHTYKITGLFGFNSVAVEASLGDDGSIQIKSQQSIGTTTHTTGGNTYPVTLNLYGRKTASGSAFSGVYPLLKATLDDSDNTIGILSPAGETYMFYTLYGSYVNNDNETKGLNYGTRPASATMTKTE